MPAHANPVTSIRRLHRFFRSHPLTGGAPSAAWRRFLAWQVKSRLAEEVIVPWIAGQRLAARRGMTGATGNIYTGLHEFADMMFVLHALREGDLFFDVGANIGSYTVLASGVCRARTAAFEPDPGTARHLARNVELNGLGERVTIHEIALGAQAGTVAFTVGLDTANRVATARQTNVRHVRQEPLDAVATGLSPMMMKVDVEGYEAQFFAGATATLKTPSLRAIAVETVTPEIENRLAASGFARAYYDPFSRTLADAPGAIAASNALYVRDRSFIAARIRAATPLAIHGHCL